MALQEVVLGIISVVSAFLIVIVAVCLGWYLVWFLFLSRFKLVRELLGGINDSKALSSPVENQLPRSSKSKRSTKEN